MEIHKDEPVAIFHGAAVKRAGLRKIGLKWAGRTEGGLLMEAGDPSVSLDLLIRSLLHLGATRQDLARHLSVPPGKRAA